MEKTQMVIRVEIADKSYRMTINVEDEEKVRRAALRIKKEIAELRRKFDTSYVDYLAMAALQISIENETNYEKLLFSAERLQMEEMTKQIDAILEKKE